MWCVVWCSISFDDLLLSRWYYSTGGEWFGILIRRCQHRRLEDCFVRRHRQGSGGGTTGKARTTTNLSRVERKSKSEKECGEAVNRINEPTPFFSFRSWSRMVVPFSGVVFSMMIPLLIITSINIEFCFVRSLDFRQNNRFYGMILSFFGTKAKQNNKTKTKKNATVHTRWEQLFVVSSFIQNSINAQLMWFEDLSIGDENHFLRSNARRNGLITNFSFRNFKFYIIMLDASETQGNENSCAQKKLTKISSIFILNKNRIFLIN